MNLKEIFKILGIVLLLWIIVSLFFVYGCTIYCIFPYKADMVLYEIREPEIEIVRDANDSTHTNQSE